MAQKFFYVVDHAIPFPQSEYGGIFNVICENDEECFDLISSTCDYDGYDEYFPNLMENIVKCDKFPLDGEHETKIVASFLT